MAWNPFNQIGLKAVSLALGALLWLVVSGHQIERRIPVSVSYSNVPAPLQMTGDQVDDVSVHVRGSDNILSTLGQGAIRVLVDLGDAHSGPNLIPLRTDEVVAPLGIEIMQIDPGAVTVTLEKSGELPVAVKPVVEGEPAAGYAVVGPVVVIPRTVIVIGPESQLKNPVAVVTERVSIDGRTSTLVTDVSVGVADGQLRVREPRTVRVTVRIEPVRSDGGRQR